MRPEDFDYELDAALIAHQPVEPRDQARLLVDRGESFSHLRIADLPSLVGEGDVVVLNDTRVLPARLEMRKPTGGKVEILLLEAQDDGSWECLVRPSRRVPEGMIVQAASGLLATVGADMGEGRRSVCFETEGKLLDAFEAAGEMPLPPYLNTVLADPERYQTIYARRAASAAAPTAGLHITDEVLAGIRHSGAQVQELELVVGLDTFRPMSADHLDDHRMHSESYAISAQTWASIAEAKRVIAVGTTTVRALESAAASGQLSGRTDIFIRRPFDFKVVDAMITNFHLPKSTLLVMIDAFVGDRWRAIYQAARDDDYRFLSFGDAMLLTRTL